MYQKDILSIQVEWNAKIGSDAQDDLGDFIGPSCKRTSNEKIIHLLKFAKNNMVLTNTLGEHKASRK